MQCTLATSLGQESAWALLYVGDCRHARSAPHGVSRRKRSAPFPARTWNPFDRLPVAQTLAEAMTLVSNEALFDGYGVQRLW